MERETKMVLSEGPYMSISTGDRLPPGTSPSMPGVPIASTQGLVGETSETAH